MPADAICEYAVAEKMRKNLSITSRFPLADEESGVGWMKSLLEVTEGSNPSRSAAQSELQSKAAAICLGIREGCPFFAITPKQTGPEKRTACRQEV
jgi:hypothetical protein